MNYTVDSQGRNLWFCKWMWSFKLRDVTVFTDCCCIIPALHLYFQYLQRSPRFHSFLITFTSIYCLSLDDLWRYKWQACVWSTWISMDFPMTQWTTSTPASTRFPCLLVSQVTLFHSMAPVKAELLLGVFFLTRHGMIFTFYLYSSYQSRVKIIGIWMGLNSFALCVNDLLHIPLGLDSTQFA